MTMTETLPGLHRHAFRAMGNDVSILTGADPARAEAAERLAAVEALFRTNERCLSRFDPESELSQLNRAAGRPFTASRTLYAAIAASLQAATELDGLFDPTLLDALEIAGYDRTFEALPAEREAVAVMPVVAPGRWRGVQLDPATRTVRLPASVRLDLGGIGKGWTVDQAVALLGPLGPCLVDAGGDLRVHGRPPGQTRWWIGVEDPHDASRDVGTLCLADRAVATSGIGRRAWRRGGVWQHHLIDPRTGRPAATDVAAATVVAPTTVRAEVAAKVVCLLGAEAGLAWLEHQPDLAGALVRLDGGMLSSSGLEAMSNEQ